MYKIVYDGDKIKLELVGENSGFEATLIQRIDHFV